MINFIVRQKFITIGNNMIYFKHWAMRPKLLLTECFMISALEGTTHITDSPAQNLLYIKHGNLNSEDI